MCHAGFNLLLVTDLLFWNSLEILNSCHHANTGLNMNFLLHLIGSISRSPCVGILSWVFLISSIPFFLQTKSLLVQKCESSNHRGEQTMKTLNILTQNIVELLYVINNIILAFRRIRVFFE